MKTAFLEKWRNSERYLLEIAASMPEEDYAFKPTEQQMSFAEQLVHITQNMHWLSTTYFLKKEFKRSPNNANTMSKPDILALLEDSFEAT
ncbi:MAG: DinB family protein, partial [Flavobacteriaceae bacterium]|nr:DinB family protein [Flavobacteriaceae bacterium]